MRKNQLHGGGRPLGKLLSRMPSLSDLDMTSCKIEAKDMEAMSEAYDCTNNQVSVLSYEYVESILLSNYSERNFGLFLAIFELCY